MAHKKNGEPWWKTYAADPRLTDELIRLAIEEWDMEYAERSNPSAMTVLHCKADAAAFEAAQRLALSPLPVEREVGAWILGEFGHPERTMPEQCVDMLMQMLTVEADPEVLSTICHAFAHHERTDEIVRAIARFKDHPHEDVRFGVVMGLLFTDNNEAVSTLIELTRDTDDDVRDWATFGIGNVGDDTDERDYVDTPEIRQALYERLDDSHWETRFEALEGLTLRRDARVVDRIVDMLIDDNPMSNTELCDGLKAMISLYTGSKERLEIALNRCEESSEE